ncbi:hypothetical protein JXB27_02605 [Candidatus Woesearchaeota archaeon]|nr:hypothetical protein [Candidatus Woesearchaeota archaeon]
MANLYFVDKNGYFEGCGSEPKLDDLVLKLVQFSKGKVNTCEVFQFADARKMDVAIVVKSDDNYLTINYYRKK